MERKVILALILSFSLALTGCTKGGGGDDGGSGGDDGTARTQSFCDSGRVARISNGRTCQNSSQSPVVRMFLINDQGEPFGLCSGTLVTPDTVLTAAHCVDRGLGITNVFVDRDNNQDLIEASEFTAHPFYFPLPGHPNDVGVVKLTESITNRPTVGLLLSTDVSVGDRVGIYGYGFDGDADLGILREGEMEITRVEAGGILISTFDRTNQSICSGDSGGPATLSSNGITGIVGINSAGSAEGCREGSLALFVTVGLASNLNFINEQIPGISAF